MFLHKLINNRYDCPNLLESLQFKVPSRHTRSNDLFYLPFSRVNVSKRSTLNRLMHEFNLTANQIEELDFALPEGKFKKCLVSYILNSE